ncbi:hypothetical protein DPX16_18664 [Anabarilius grahami]|uniref:Uncharacterized protein n=1 Tax=Anabarilius grahami TaxID=495550 RepID=A0A3N0YPG6_ANAGA|nr:hypothetical protein DPX16_18664 [Anabarilius grahami]
MVIAGGGGMVTDGRRDPGHDGGGRPMTQTQSPEATAHGGVEGGRSQGGVEANNYGTTDGGGSDRSQGADGQRRWRRATLLAQEAWAMLRQRSSEVEPDCPRTEATLGEPVGQGNTVEPTGRRAEKEQGGLRPEVEPLDLSAQALVVVAGPEARRDCLASEEKPNG